jgi:hypothetical protein
MALMDLIKELPKEIIVALVPYAGPGALFTFGGWVGQYVNTYPPPFNNIASIIGISAMGLGVIGFVLSYFIDLYERRARNRSPKQ